LIEVQRAKLSTLLNEKSLTQSLSEFLDFLYQEVSLLLFQAITVDDTISKQLEMFRLVYLAGMGDFVDAFIDEADRLKVKLDSALIPVAGNDITQVFLRVVTDLGLESRVDEKVWRNYSFEILNENTNLKSLQSGLFGVGFQTNYELEWPLTLFISTDDIKRSIFLILAIVNY
jgi:hypothetical protein